MNTWRNARYREEEGENSWRGSGEEGNEGIKRRVPESKGTSMCLAFFKGQLCIVFVLTIEMIAVGGEKRSECQTGVTLEQLWF